MKMHCLKLSTIVKCCVFNVLQYLQQMQQIAYIPFTVVQSFHLKTEVEFERRAQRAAEKAEHARRLMELEKESADDADMDIEVEDVEDDNEEPAKKKKNSRASGSGFWQTFQKD